jgi:hypothetical protein
VACPDCNKPFQSGRYTFRDGRRVRICQRCDLSPYAQKCLDARLARERERQRAAVLRRVVPRERDCMHGQPPELCFEC